MATEPFKIFSDIHLIILSLLLCANISILFYLRYNRNVTKQKIFRITSAIILISLEIFDQWLRIDSGNWSASSSLPLHLCRIGTFITVFMLITRSYLLYEMSYFWSLGGAINALITPTISNYNILSFKFFISHNILVLSTLYMTIVEGYRPLWRSVIKVLIITHIYISVIAVVNYFLDSNYLYLCINPGKNTILGFFGEWPDYLIPFWIIGVLIFIILYSPFALRDLVHHISHKDAK